jgi:hypothetical protein
MSTDEEIQAHGRILAEYLDAKKTLIALESEATKMSEALTEMVSVLKSQKFTGREYDRAVTAFPAPEKVKQLLTDMAVTIEKKANAEKQLKELGVDFK